MDGMAVKGVLIGLALVGAALGAGWALGKIPNLPKEVSRKFVHIVVSCYYFVYARYLYGRGLLLELALPVAFIFANLYIAFTGKPKALARALAGHNRLGTVYYPVSLTVLTLMVRVLPIGMDLKDMAAGLLVMGFGDGLAGMIGSLLGRRKLPLIPHCSKTWLGSGIMLGVSFLALLLVYEGGLVFDSDVWLYLAGALAATFIEAATPRGLDNLTVPILVSLLCMAAF